MKINLAVFFLILSFFSCKPAIPDKKMSYVHSVIDSLKIDKSKNILIYTVNPNDCINCLIGFVALNNNISAVNNPRVYVVAVEREIEKEQVLSSIKNVDLNEAVNKAVVWNKEIFRRINESVSFKKEVSLSLLTIYNYQKDSIIYNRPIKEITGVDEFMSYLEK